MWENSEVDSSNDDLILGYLEGEATAAEEERFHRLLPHPAFSQRVAQFAIDLGHLHVLAQQGMLEAAAQSRRHTPRRTNAWVTSGVAAAAVLLVVTLAYRLLPSGEQQPDTQDSPQAASVPVSPSPAKQSVRQDSVARVVHILGEATVASGPRPQEVKIVATDTDIRSGETLRTVGSESFVVLEFVDKTVFAVAGDTELTCNAAEAERRVFVPAGNLMAQVVPHPGRVSMVIETPVAEAEVLGTSLSLLASSEQTELEVQEGEVRLRRRSDGQFVDVRTGQCAVVSDESDLQVESAPDVASVWEVDFENGLPRGWQLGVLVRDSLPTGSSGAVRTERCRGGFSSSEGPFRIVTNRAWSRGLFQVEEDTHLNFTYMLKMRRPFLVRLSAISDLTNLSTVGGWDYRNRDLWFVTPGQWRTVSIPLSDFGRVNGSRRVEGSNSPPAIGSWVTIVGFGNPRRDPGLVIDRIWVTRGTPDIAEVQGKPGER